MHRPHEDPGQTGGQRSRRIREGIQSTLSPAGGGAQHNGAARGENLRRSDGGSNLGWSNSDSTDDFITAQGRRLRLVLAACAIASVVVFPPVVCLLAGYLGDRIVYKLSGGAVHRLSQGQKAFVWAAGLLMVLVWILVVLMLVRFEGHK